MAYKFFSQVGNWVTYRRLPDLVEVDFHYEKGDYIEHYYEQRMEQVWDRSLDALKQAQTEGKQFVLFTHGHSTSRAGKTTARSQVRKLMGSKDATPFIIRKNCIQHYSVFVAAIKPLDKAVSPASAAGLLKALRD